MTLALAISHDLPLGLSLVHMADLLGLARSAQAGPLARSAALDPFHLDLPPVDGAAAALDAASLGVLAALYFAAEIEATYLPAVAEELVKNRFGLNLTDRGAAEAMEALARATEHGWINRDLRNQIFARVFGVGQDDPNLGDGGVNREFEPRFGRFCGAVLAVAQQMDWGGGSGAAIRLVVAAQAVLGNLAPKLLGNTLVVTERLARQLQLSLTALNHPGLAQLFGGRNAWDVVRNLLGSDAPDLAGSITLAQTGMRLFSWMAANLVSLQGEDTPDLLAALRDNGAVTGWAEQWLSAAGVPQPAHGALIHPVPTQPPWGARA